MKNLQESPGKHGERKGLKGKIILPYSKHATVDP